MAAQVRVIVLGGSVKALACACELAVRGASVTVAKTREQQKIALGQKVAGFSFDPCETMITRLQALVTLFARAGREVADYLAITQIDPFMRFWFKDGVMISARRDAGLFARQLDQQFPLDLQGANYCNVVSARRAGNDVGASESMKFITEPHVAQIVNCLYAGLDSCGVDSVDSGMWYTFGGVRQVGFALERLSAELGVEHCVGASVSKDTKGNTGAVANVDGRTMKADAVIDCEDGCGKYSRWLVGIDRRYPHLALHNVFQTSNGEQIHVAAPCAIDPSHAPVGGDALRIDVRSLKKGSSIERNEDIDFSHLQKCGMEDLEKRIVVKRLLVETSDEQDAGLAAFRGVAEAKKAMESLRIGPVDARPLETVTTNA